MRTPTSSGRKSRPPRRRKEKTKKSSRKTRRSSRSAPRKKSTDSSAARARVAYLGLGSNVGDRRRRILRAIAEISGRMPLARVSSLYSSAPVGFRGQRRFFNAAAEVLWTGTPGGLLEAVKDIERRCGRRPTFRNGPREIDIDILDLGGLVSSGRDLALPHPRLAGRRFALTPLAEIAPEWVHPIRGMTAAELLARLPRKPDVR